MCVSTFLVKKMAKHAIEAYDSDEMDINNFPKLPVVETSLGCSKCRKVIYFWAAKYPSKFKSEWTKCSPVHTLQKKFSTLSSGFLAKKPLAVATRA